MKIQSVFSRTRQQAGVVRRIGEAVAEKFPDFPQMNIMGPFGLCCEWSLDFFKDINQPINTKYSQHNHRGVVLRDIDLDGKTLKVVDYNHDTGKFKPGTIGQLNGLNYPGIKFSAGDSLDDLVQYFK
jgi:hypothetical protein